MENKLVKLLEEAFLKSDDNYGMPNVEQVARYLIAHDVTIPEVKHGQIVWFYVPHRDKPFELKKGRVLRITTSMSMKTLLEIRHDDNTIDSVTEYLGLKVFLTEEGARNAMEEAEKKLKGAKG